MARLYYRGNFNTFLIVVHRHRNHTLKLLNLFLELDTIKDELQRDKDVMRKTFFGIDTTEALREQKPLKCTLEDEYKPPAERPSIQNMLALGRQRPKHTKIWNPKTGMDYYPFHR